MKCLPPKVQSITYMEHIAKFHLDLRISRYRNSPKVSCLGMNHGIGWNPHLKESYLPEDSESKAKTFTLVTSGIYLRLVNISAPDPSPI